jgi:hypothetical protein
MNIKFIFRISVLIFALCAVIFASKYFSSDPFQSSLDEMFNLPGKPFQWCVYMNTKLEQKFKWVDAAIDAKMQARPKPLTQDQMAQKYCTVQMENIESVDLKKVRWVRLAQGFDSGGQAVLLEWDVALQVFRVAGLPFKSSILYSDLTN